MERKLLSIKRFNQIVLAQKEEYILQNINNPQLTRIIYVTHALGWYPTWRGVEVHYDVIILPNNGYEVTCRKHNLTMKTTMNILEQHISWASKVMMEGNSNVAIPEVTFFIVCFNISITEYKDILESTGTFYITTI